MHDRLDSLDVGQGPDKRRIAVRVISGDGPGVFWLGGFNSDMKGTKAQALAGWAAKHGRACVRFDYSGHGESGGSFADPPMLSNMAGSVSASLMTMKSRNWWFRPLGASRAARILVVCHCYREDGDVIRLISARRADRAERGQYISRWDP